MKILHVISSVDPKKGGPIEGLLQLSRSLFASGHIIEILTLDPPGTEVSEMLKVKIYTLGRSFFGYRYNPRLVSWLRKNAKNYDAVVVNGIWQYGSFAVWRALSNGKTPYFVFTHGMLDPWFKKQYPVKHLKKWMYWPWAEYRVLRDANAVIFTCEEERILAKQSFFLYQANEVVTSYGTARPPSNEEELAKRFLMLYPHLKDKRVILFLSRIHEKKGCDLLLDAFARIAEMDGRLHLVVAGPGDKSLVALLHARAKELGIEQRITWPGMLQGDEKWAAYYAAEVFCLPSHQENFGIVVAEALACGKPVLISNKVNIWREIKADSAGFVDEDTVDGTVRNLERWLKLNKNDYLMMADRARTSFSKNFHIEKAAERLMEIVGGDRS